MFNLKSKDEEHELQKTIDDLIQSMAQHPCDSEEYAKMVDHLSELYSLKEANTPKPISRDTLATIGANLLGIVMIVGHERAHVVTSKAITFVKKLW